MSARAVRITVVSAAMIIFALHLGQGYLEVSRARASVEELGRTLVESASVAVATPLWVLSEHTVREFLRSLAAHGSVQRAVVYDDTQPALLYEREYGIRGGLQESSDSIADPIDPGSPRSEYTLYRFSRDITFEGDRIGSVEIYLDNGRIVERIWNVVWRSMVFLAGEIAVILLLLRVRTARLRAVGLHRERDELEKEVDQYFVRGMKHDRSLPIIRAINDLAQASGMGAVVEGIETEDDAKLARKAGCRMGQGYLYGRPVPAPELFPDYERIQASTSSKESAT